MKILVVATGNEHKLKEIKEIFSEYKVISQKEAGFNFEVEENGKSFLENAIIKAKAAAEYLNIPTLADDSGLCVNALNGAPGIYSARYAGEHGNDKKNRAFLLNNLKDKSDRSAYFESAIALVFPNGHIYNGSGKTFGSILKEEIGENGFGYDCLFYSDDLKKSFGIASAEEKNSVSHRYRALCNLKEKTKGIL